jgi:hypothetical protein
MVAAFVGKDAKLVAHGKPPLTWKVPSVGNLAVMDKTAGAVLAYCTVGTPGQLLSIDPEQATVVLKSPTAADRFDVLASDIDTTHDYAVYFKSTKTWLWQAPPKPPTAQK